MQRTSAAPRVDQPIEADANSDKGFCLIYTDATLEICSTQEDQPLSLAKIIITETYHPLGTYDKPQENSTSSFFYQAQVADPDAQ